MNKSLLLQMDEDDLRELLQKAIREELASAFARLHDQRPNGTPLLTRTELCEHLRCSRNHVAALIRRGMPSLHLGADRRFRVEDVEAWMAAHSPQRRVPAVRKTS